MTAPAPPPAPTPAPPAPAPSPPPPPPSLDADTAELGTRLLAELRTEIARADSKASVLVAALGTTAGVLSGLLAGRGWRPDSLSVPGSALWWAGAAAFGLALLALLMAVLPRYRRRAWAPGAPLTYFGDIQQAHAHGQLEQALAETARSPAATLRASLAENSRIAVRKHQWIRTGLIAFCAGAAALPASLLIG
ncbi:Pycsar system effector family protein [Streptomyces sp. NPDC088745]|uniref:Pycsar system effector family protein n=1 Tax=Streptomyces sp. NPDC088745 TaxID=3365884 RepID=UPI003800F529